MITKHQGFTLIEVLIALAIVAIAFTALIQSNAQSIRQTQRVQEKTLSHWVMKQGITMVQLGLIQPDPNQTHATRLLGQRWYWRAQTHSTSLKHVQQLQIRASLSISGPFTESLSGYLYVP